MGKYCLPLFLFACFPCAAHARSEEVLLFPIGTLAAIILSVTWRAHWPVRITAAVAAFLASVPVWNLPGTYFPEAIYHSGLGNFVVGFLPSFAAAVLVFWLRSLWRNAKHDT
jgi:hypothetical protein